MRLAQPQLLATRHGLLPEARHVVLPDGIVSSGFPAVRETCRSIGIEFDDWQVDLNRCILAKTADGLYAADTVVLSIARQVGKTFDIGAVVFALCIANPGLTVVWTAHRFKVSRETFNELHSLAKSPKLAPHLDYDDITTGAGTECIPFRNGSRIVFAARERGAIRGFTKVGILVLDEAQILTQGALSDLAPTMNQATNPLIIMMGTPPKPTDPSEVFTEIRAEALKGESEGTLYVEFSAEVGCDPNDRDAWRQANPSYPKRTPARAILRLLKLLGPDGFMREALGVWDDVTGKSVIPTANWSACLDVESRIQGLAWFALDVAPDYLTASIGAAGLRADRLNHVEVVEARDGVDWVVPRCVELNMRWPDFAVHLVAGSPAESLKSRLGAAGIRVVVLPASAVPTACGLLFNEATAALPRLRHIGQGPLDDALKAARKNVEGGEGAWRFGRRKSTASIVALYSITLALHAATQAAIADIAPTVIFA